MKPALFGQVMAKFPDGLPSDANLRARLLTEWGFVAEKAADNFIASLREAVSIAGRDGVARVDESVDNEDISTTGEPMTPSVQPELSQPALRTPSMATPSSHAKPAAYQSRSWNLGGGVTMVVNVPNNLTPNQVEKLKKYVAVLEQEASISWDDDTDPDEDDGN
jgi:hypothetical protein